MANELKNYQSLPVLDFINKETNTIHNTSLEATLFYGRIY